MFFTLPRPPPYCGLTPCLALTSVQFQAMKTAIIIAIFLINVCMSKKNLTDVDDKKENQNGTDNSTNNFQIEEGQYTFFGCKL